MYFYTLLVSEWYKIYSFVFTLVNFNLNNKLVLALTKAIWQFLFKQYFIRGI